MKTGLVLEGGAMRGMFTAGVLDVFMERDVRVDGVIGVSAGAVFGCNYKSRQIGRVIRYNKKYCADKRYCGFRSWLSTGDYYNVAFDYDELPRRLDIFDTETFESSPVEFYVVATDALTGEPVYHRCTDGGENDISWMRASASMPGLSRLVELDGYLLSDGGTADSVPLRFFESIGYDKNVVVCTQPKGYRKEKNKMLPALKVMLRKTPMLYKALADRHIRYNALMDYIDECESSGKIVVIRPDAPLSVEPGERDPEKLERVYQLGVAQGRRRLEEVRSFLSSAD